ncbi:hypothetical protein [Streptomyces sp. NPDC053079]|uniref:hypothetical protein n=1 Tax=Streptomyces sp. NPDC053079 TaxID=3365697 RepID=UPI0037CE66DB
MCAAKDPTLPSPGDAVPGWLNDLGRLYFSKEDGDQVKAKVNGLSIGVDHLKLAMGLAAVGATAVKLDFTGLKVDEKGIVLFGKQKVTWPHARDDKAKADTAEKLLNKRLGKYESEVVELRRLVRAKENSAGDSSYLTKQIKKRIERLERLQGKADKAQQTLKTVNATDESKKAGHKKLRDDENGELKRMSQTISRVRGEVNGLSQAASRLSGELAGGS